jgi:hypothetical protein
VCAHFLGHLKFTSQGAIRISTQLFQILYLAATAGLYLHAKTSSSPCYIRIKEMAGVPSLPSSCKLPRQSYYIMQCVEHNI